MAGYTDLCDSIAAGFDPCGKAASSAGIEPGIYAGNVKDFTFTYSTTNPLIVTGITAVGAALLYKIKGTGDNFNAMSKLAKKAVGGRYTETVSFYITDNSTTTKKFVVAGANGRQFYIVVNNDKSSDGAVELYGAVNGLQFSDNTQRDAQDEDMQGAWKIEATNPPKLTEPYPPRAVSIAAGEDPATVASTLAALEALLT